MMLIASLIFSGTSWLWPTAGAVGVMLLAVWWGYRSATSGGWPWVCAALKVLGVAALAFCLLEPLRLGQRARPGANLFAIVADNSQGLQIKDEGETRTRGEVLQTLLQGDGSEWRKDLEDQFEVRRFLFDARLQATRDFADLTFNGRLSALGSALSSLAQRFEGRPLAGVLLLTDGNATDLPGALPAWNGLPPVYPVVIGQEGGARDAAISQVHVSQTAFEDAPVTILADVTVAGLRGESLAARLVDRSGRKRAEEERRVRRNEETVSFRFQFRPDEPGISFYRLAVGLRDEMRSSDSTSHSSEVTLLNNERIVPVDRGRGPYRILYVAGRPNWEYKFLNRALQQDDQVQLVALLRIALREPKFEFRGRSGETGNPLFRGFGDQAREQVERYDQPVLVRLNTRDELELRAGFPRTPGELYGYHALILDDVEAAFFMADQAMLVQKFVSERGGGLLMLGGAESFRQGEYQHTPIGDLLPVYLDHAPEVHPSGPLRFQLAREGWLQAWVRLRENEGDEKARLETMSAFQVFNPVRDVKPGASVLATAKDAQGRDHPALVTQRFGRGRTAALTVGDIWRWGMHDADARRDMEKSWRQLVRWLVADVPDRVELTVTQAPGGNGEAVQLELRARDEEFAPLDDATVTLEVRPELSEANGRSTNAVRLRAEPSLREAGLYEAAFMPRETGGYRAEAFVTNNVGAEIGRAEVAWSSDVAAEEFRSLQPNAALLGAIARRTGGELVPAAKLSEFVRRLPTRQAPVMDAWTRPAWHTPLVLGFALACFAAEWGLRRSRGLP